MSFDMQKCLGCGNSVKNKFKLCPECSAKSDLGIISTEPVLATGLIFERTSRGTSYQRNMLWLVMVFVLSLVTVVGLSPLGSGTHDQPSRVEGFNVC